MDSKLEDRDENRNLPVITMELTELSSQLKTFDIVDNDKTFLPVPSNRINPFETENRRLTRSQTMPKSDVWTSVELPTQKTSKKMLDTEDEIKKIYLNNKVKLVHRNLETIFEDPVIRKGNTMFLGAGKQKRSLYLCREFRIITKQKSKIRKTKIKRLGKKSKPFKMSDAEFNEKMKRIECFINSEDSDLNKMGDSDANIQDHSESLQTEMETH